MTKWEQSDRAREVTRIVSLWVENTQEVYFPALELAQRGDIETLRKYHEDLLKWAVRVYGDTVPPTNNRARNSAWYTAQDIMPSDYSADRINWEEIAETLTAE